MEPYSWSISEARQALAAGTCSAVELTQSFLSRIERFNQGLRAYLSVSEHAVEEARRIDTMLANGQRRSELPLAGIPIAIKDLFDTTSLPTTYGGRHTWPAPTADATVVTRLRRAGAIILGKTNLHEYAYGTTTENPHYGTAVNPWNRAKIAGGSSGGSSVAVTAGLCTAALGTDTGGSIRIPAALTGHVGLKPTFGLVSKAGVFPLARSLDHVGPMTRSVRDAALMLDVLAGYDPLDETSVRTPKAAYQPYSLDIKTLRVGIPKNFFFDKCHANVLQTVHNALQKLRDQGLSLREVTIANVEEVPDMQTATIASEAFSVHKHQFQNHSSLYGWDVRQRLEDSQQTLGYKYVDAQRFRLQLSQNLDRLFDKIDILLTPSTPLTATDVGQTKAHIRAQEVNIRAHLTRFTNPWNLTGFPALTIPCGLSPDGLPVGLQLVGPRFSERKLLMVGELFEAVFGWSTLAPEYR